MPSECRRVTVAPGHTVLARRLSATSSRAGYVRVETKRSGQFDVPEAAWTTGEVAR